MPYQCPNPTWKPNRYTSSAYCATREEKGESRPYVWSPNRHGRWNDPLTHFTTRTPTGGASKPMPVWASLHQIWINGKCVNVATIPKIRWCHSWCGCIMFVLRHIICLAYCANNRHKSPNTRNHKSIVGQYRVTSIMSQVLPNYCSV